MQPMNEENIPAATTVKIICRAYNKFQDLILYLVNVLQEGTSILLHKYLLL
jgi:hypothetical protein